MVKNVIHTNTKIADKEGSLCKKERSLEPRLGAIIMIGCFLYSSGLLESKSVPLCEHIMVYMHEHYHSYTVVNTSLKFCKIVDTLLKKKIIINVGKQDSAGWIISCLHSIATNRRPGPI